ncbi:hypothetical protein EVAR_21895_1 [Eumeta japonica]|uniref:Transposase Tc1-like domain-containing protein n=1 Tax=Eumeta variegata TaxID=151549 RepID=A0A4C2A9A4_EUMVA|nr:hypothetical protein EVAR_11260_1 [Eumeta japonica]GBP95774.1 hypothetical protein EVAR_21895_1 [Eumeta japonica]
MDTPEVITAQAVALLEHGLSQRNVAKRHNLSRLSVRIVHQRYSETRSFCRRPGSRRPRATSQTDDLFEVLVSSQDRRLSAVNLQYRLREDRRIIVKEITITRRLKQSNFRPYKAVIGPKLTTRHGRARH